MTRDEAEVIVMLLMAYEQEKKSPAPSLNCLIDDACKVAYSVEERAQVSRAVKEALILLSGDPDYYAPECPSCVRGTAEVLGMKVYYHFSNAEDQWGLDPLEW